MPNTSISYRHLVNRLPMLQRRTKTLLIGIDGCGASGKSTFSKTLRALAPKISVIQMDDFFLPSNQRLAREIAAQQIGADFDWPRVRSEVLEPLRSDKPGRFQRYDWDNDQLAEWHEIPIGGIVIVEGIYSTRRELSEFYDLKIWVECPRDLRLARGIQRDGEDARPVWEQDWMPAEDLYLKTHKPFDYADLIIDGSRSPDSVDAGFICLRAKEGFGDIFA